MKKTILFVAFSLLTLTNIHAQIMNRTHHLNKYDIYPKCLLPKVPDSLIFTSSSLGVNNNYVSLLLTKLNASGGVLQTLQIDTPFVNHRLAKTDNGVILAAQLDSGLYVMNFDNKSYVTLD